jgi:hypothetical protein
MLGQSSLPIEKPSLLLPVEADVASQRRTRFLWTGFGFAVLVLLAVSACAILPLASYTSARPSRFVPEIAFGPSPLSPGAGGIRTAARPIHTGGGHVTGLHPVFLPGQKKQQQRHPMSVLRMSGGAGELSGDKVSSPDKPVIGEVKGVSVIDVSKRGPQFGMNGDDISADKPAGEGQAGTAPESDAAVARPTETEEMMAQPTEADQWNYIKSQMNDAHADSLLAYAIFYGGLRDARNAVLDEVSPQGFRMTVSLASGETKEVLVSLETPVGNIRGVGPVMQSMSKIARNDSLNMRKE